MVVGREWEHGARLLHGRSGGGGDGGCWHQAHGTTTTPQVQRRRHQPPLPRHYHNRSYFYLTLLSFSGTRVIGIRYWTNYGVISR